MLDRDPTLDEIHARAPWLTVLLEEIGVTRLLDVTHLDYVGMPVFQAVRPRARSYVVTQGKGLTAERAAISAVVEAAELFCAERARRDLTGAPIGAMRSELGYRPEQIQRIGDVALDDALQLDWIVGESLVGGTTQYLPHDLVSADYVVRAELQGSPFRRTTNGLGAGRTRDDARLHGMYEVLERHALSRATPRPIRYVPRAPALAALFDAIAGAGLRLEVAMLANPLGLPIAKAAVREPDTGLAFVGSGAAADLESAVRSAVTEAVQSRLTVITGSRDDLDESHYRAFTAARPADRCTADDAHGLSDHAFASPRDELAWLVARVHACTGIDPISVDLTPAGFPIHVAYTAAIGLAFDARLH